MTAHRLVFGYCPETMRLQAGPVTVEPLPELAETVAGVEAGESIENGWIHAPPQQVRSVGGEIWTLPYPSRVFSLPKTHVIEHATADSEDQLTFHLWTLSLFSGMRLTATEAGFLDATPLKPGKLVDFALSGRGLIKAIQLAEVFWKTNRASQHRARLFAAAVHALFLGQSPRHLQFENFLYLYTAFDACFALATAMHPPKVRVTHAERVTWMCDLLGMVTPAWAEPAAPAGPAVAALRNATVHEALYVGEPLGFAVYGIEANHNLNLEMQGLICRFLVAFVGGGHTDYVLSPINTRQRHRLDLK